MCPNANGTYPHRGAAAGEFLHDRRKHDLSDHVVERQVPANAELPLISKQAEQQVLDAAVVPEAPDDWRDEHGPDVPIFWQESKSIAFWTGFLDQLKVHAIMDLRPGSGALLEAALSRGILYHGLCRNRPRMNWLQAIAGKQPAQLRVALGYSCRV